MNPETKKILQNKISEIDNKTFKLQADLDTAERNLKNQQAAVNNIKEEIQSLRKEKEKIKEDIEKDKIKEG